MYDRKIELMTRERREMIAKNLEESKERMELNQKLLQCEKETASYKSKVTKLTLEKERLARQLAKQADQENIPAVAVRAVPQL
jgi:seryl-tRNA synthetase